MNDLAKLLLDDPLILTFARILRCSLLFWCFSYKLSWGCMLESDFSFYNRNFILYFFLLSSVNRKNILYSVSPCRVKFEMELLIAHGLVQDANALELLQSCTKPSMCFYTPLIPNQKCPTHIHLIKNLHFPPFTEFYSTYHKVVVCGADLYEAGANGGWLHGLSAVGISGELWWRVVSRHGDDDLYCCRLFLWEGLVWGLDGQLRGEKIIN